MSKCYSYRISPTQWAFVYVLVAGIGFICGAIFGGAA